ncbi:MAG: hypothetical protein H6828_14040 [Planctomycetes bacterium]|nr:hypothetical protein [Planctomycetota bacterium]
MQATLLLLAAGLLLLASCQDKEVSAEQAPPTAVEDVLPSAAEVEAIEAEAQNAADAINDQTADDALKALEAEIDSNE